MNMAKEAEIVDATSTDIMMYDPAIFPDLLTQDPAEVAARFADRFGRAETLEDLFNVLEGTASKDLVGHRVEIRGVKWAPYESDQGVIPNAICEAVDIDSGEVLEFATTSQMLTLFIRRAEILGQIPFQAQITGKKTRSGRTALNFERL